MCLSWKVTCVGIYYDLFDISVKGNHICRGLGYGQTRVVNTYTAVSRNASRT